MGKDGEQLAGLGVWELERQAVKGGIWGPMMDPGPGSECL